MLDELGEQAFRQAFPARLLDSLPHALHFRSGWHNLQNAVEVDAIVPDIQRAHRSIVGHSFTVGAHSVRCRLRRVAVEEVEMAGGDDDAGRESLYIPLPGSRQGFVEIVDVEENVALRRGEAAEIHQVSIATGLDAKSGGRGRRQIGRHDRGRAAIEGERRLGHATEADRNQFWDAAFVGLAQKLDRIAPILGRLPAAMRGARRRVAQRLARGAPLVCRYVAPGVSLVGLCFAFVLRMPTLPSQFLCLPARFPDLSLAQRKFELMVVRQVRKPPHGVARRGVGLPR